jgi:DNA-binding transcriptional LysR family regulator
VDIKVLEYIIAIADEKSLSRAADKFILSPAALSQHLKKIEENLGAHLFMRVGGELTLTDIGKIFINGARSTLFVQREALSKISAMRCDLTSCIRMIMDEHTINQIKTDIIPLLRRSFPQLELKLISGSPDITKDYLANGMAELGIITTSYIKHDMLEFCPLHKDELALVMPTANTLVSVFENDGVSWDALSSDYFILNKVDDSFRHLQQEVMDKYRFHPQILYEVGTLHAARHMVENGLGNAILPLDFLDAASPSYRVFRFDPPNYIYTSAVYPKSMIINKPIKELLSIMRSFYKDFEYNRS